ncbi:MAG: MBL fold metallo-hydrolase [bacterium]
MFRFSYKKLLPLVVIFLLLIFSAVYHWQDNFSGLRIYFLNVGQGDASLIRTPGHNNILIDGGPNQTVLKELSKHLPWIDRTIDLMILTHPHSDHLEGLNQVIQRYNVGQILMTGVVHNTPTYEEWLKLIKIKQIPVKIIEYPQQIIVDDLVLDLLYPQESLLNQEVKSLNNSSIVLKLKYQGTDILFMGDAETEVENELLSSQIDLSAQILKVAHHGSKDATSKEFLEAVQPDFAIISVGADNQFNHPSLRTIMRIAETGTEILRTDQGTIRLSINQTGKSSFDILE